MKPAFFIFSQMRSGSSWLSVFLTSPKSYCYHEPTADYSVSKWKEVSNNRPEPIVGAVDTGAHYFSESIYKLLPNTKFYTLHRDPYEVSRSVRNIPIEGYDAFAECTKLKALEHESIFYSKLHDIEYLEDTWDVIIGTPFDAERAKVLIEMQIERNIKEFYMERPNAIEHFRSLMQ